ncbi:hypothetical protein TRFO_23446 [Tritrichomonas foetus]|uniref:Uncharacterized protein n=1 Tax=Tritrichomonas foetus TaxID=1144522 RepID=A0A1J4KB74_9EUKA|nr:hypothetical protein TRFO_23446 [Tritrichomonas foetus]|eukprot:OHT08160.1 hypothetical protein TRFO_23446 [Tritrichomonas foetus]
MSIDPSNPLAALLAQHPESTVLDDHFNKSFAPKNNAPAPDIVVDEKSDDDNAPIGLNFRQPSFTSLHGELRTKAGVTVQELPDLNESDAIVVLDDHDDNENVPITLSYRQPSFSSMGDHLIGKGGVDNLNDFHPVKTMPIDEVPEHHTDGEGSFEEEEEDCREVVIVKELRNKNKERWEQMGYEPPKNLIQLTRAASQSQFNQQQLLQSKQPNMTLQPIAPLIEEEPAQEPAQAEPQQSIPPPAKAKTPAKGGISPKHRRCGSNGMKLGEASTSLARLSQALMIGVDKNDERADAEYHEYQEEIQENPNEGEYNNSQNEDLEEEEDVFEEEEDEYQNDNEEDEDRSELFGRLGEIVREPKSSIVYYSLLHNSVSKVKKADITSVRSALKAISEKCIDNLWIEETSYVNDLMNSLGDSNSPRKSPKKSSNEDSEVQQLREKCKKSQQKYANRIESEKIKHKAQLDQLYQEYQEAAAALDAKYQSQEMINKFNRPSRALVAMRERVKQMLRNNQIDIAKKENQTIKQQEEKETKENAKELREKYYQADRRLKELYAGKREILVRKYNLQVQQLEASKVRSKRKYDNLIQRIKNEQLQKATGRLSATNKAEKTQPLNVKAPKPLNRARDEQLLEAMSSEIGQGKDIGKLDIDALFRKSSRTPNRYHTPRK